MFNSLSGTVTYKGANLLFLSTNGVEWEIHTTGTSLESLPEAGKEARVFVHLVHREDSMRLYGFSSAGERELFLEIVKVDGVGPKLAQKILSSIKRAEFVAVIEREDLAALEALPGLGKKTAQKIIFHLKGKMPGEGVTPVGDDALVADLVNALVGMGFDKKSSREAVIKVWKEIGTDSSSAQEREQEAFRRALAFVSREGQKR